MTRYSVTFEGVPSITSSEPARMLELALRRDGRVVQRLAASFTTEAILHELGAEEWPVPQGPMLAALTRSLRPAIQERLDDGRLPTDNPAKPVGLQLALVEARAYYVDGDPPELAPGAVVYELDDPAAG